MDNVIVKEGNASAEYGNADYDYPGHLYFLGF